MQKESKMLKKEKKMNRDEQTIDFILSQLKEVWLEFPEKPLAKLIIEVFRECDLFDVDDEEFISELKRRHEADTKHLW